MAVFSDVFLLVEKNFCEFTKGEEKELEVLNDKIKFYYQCFERICEYYPSRKKSQAIKYSDVVPRFNKMLREVMLTHHWSQAVKYVHSISKDSDKTDNIVWKAGLACLIQNGTPKLLDTFINQVRSLHSLTCAEVLLDYLLHLLTLGDLLSAKELISDLKKHDRHQVKSNERRKEALMLFYAYQGMVFYLEWKSAVHDKEPEFDSDDSDELMDVDMMTLSKCKKKSLSAESTRAVADQALEYLLMLKDEPGVWDIFFTKVVMIYEHYGQIEDARALLQLYIKKNPENPNAHIYLYEFELRNDGGFDERLQHLMNLMKRDPCNPLALTLFKNLKRTDPKLISSLFDFLDYDHCKDDVIVWKLFSELLTQIKEGNLKSLKDTVNKCWTIRKDWWPSYIFQFDKDQHSQVSDDGVSTSKSSLTIFKKIAQRAIKKICAKSDDPQHSETSDLL